MNVTDYGDIDYMKEESCAPEPVVRPPGAPVGAGVGAALARTTGEADHAGAPTPPTQT